LEDRQTFTRRWTQSKQPELRAPGILWWTKWFRFYGLFIDISWNGNGDMDVVNTRLLSVATARYSDQNPIC
jgi:hypothetical protein